MDRIMSPLPVDEHAAAGLLGAVLLLVRVNIILFHYHVFIILFHYHVFIILSVWLFSSSLCDFNRIIQDNGQDNEYVIMEQDNEYRIMDRIMSPLPLNTEIGRASCSAVTDLTAEHGDRKISYR